MTTSSHPFAEWGSPLSHMHLTGGVMRGRRARQLSKRFARVGVRVAPRRLRDIAAGGRCEDDEWFDIEFALIAAQTQQKERGAKVVRMRRRGVWWLILAGVLIAALNFLVCLTYLMLSLAQQSV